MVVPQPELNEQQIIRDQSQIVKSKAAEFASSTDGSSGMMLQESKQLFGALANASRLLLNDAPNQQEEADTVCSLGEQLAKQQQRVQAYVCSFQHATQNYQLDKQNSNIRSHVERHCQNYQNQSPSNCQDYVNLNNMVKEIVDNDDDIVVEETCLQQIGILNEVCPISGKHVKDLTDPVEDDKGYIYDKYSIEQYFQQKQAASVKCPIQGANHVVVKKSLKPSRKAKLAAKAFQAQLTQARGADVASL